MDAQDHLPMQKAVADLRRRLKALPFSARRIALEASCDPKTVGNIINGKDPRPTTHDALLAALPALERLAASSKGEAA